MPSRFWAFVLTLVAMAALIIPIVHTSRVAHTFGPFGTLMAWTAVSVAIFAILTVVVSVIRSLLLPRLRGEAPPPQDGNL